MPYDFDAYLARKIDDHMDDATDEDVQQAEEEKAQAQIDASERADQW